MEIKVAREVAMTEHCVRDPGLFRVAACCFHQMSSGQKVSVQILQAGGRNADQSLYHLETRDSQATSEVSEKVEKNLIKSVSSLMSGVPRHLATYL